jgi:hypothetical protein
LAEFAAFGGDDLVEDGGQGEGFRVWRSELGDRLPQYRFCL